MVQIKGLLWCHYAEEHVDMLFFNVKKIHLSRIMLNNKRNIYSILYVCMALYFAEC